MPTVLVTGANRGIGLAYVRQYAADGWRVLAGARDPAHAEDLKRLGGTVEPIRLDVTDIGSIRRAADDLAGAPVDLLINNAGISDWGQGRQRRFTTGLESIDSVDPDVWLKVFDTNSIGPFRVTTAFLPNLEKGGRKQVVMMSTGMASIATASGGSYAYRSSKAALNMVTVVLAKDLKPKGITVVAVTPGWVRTDMGGPQAELTPDQAVADLRALFDRLTPEDSGRFLRRNGEEYPW